MVIDKTTGRGCALSMASKAITGKLIDEGIVGKTIGKRHRINSKNSYNLLQVAELTREKNVYVISQKDKGLTEEPLWTPSFIEAEIWAQAVSKFSNFERLERNVEKYLLPKMDAYLQSISDAELISLTRDFLIEQGVINTPICQRKGNTYYFSENEIYSLDKKSELFPYESRTKYNIFRVYSAPCFNVNVWKKAVSRFEAGMTLEECVSIFLQTELGHNVPQELSPVDRLVQYIASPVYERVPGNNNAATFDHIRMTVGLPRYQFNSWEILKDEVKKYRREIYQRVIEKLEQDHQFKKYGVPINFLELNNVILLRDFFLEFIFTLKEQKTDSTPDNSFLTVGKTSVKIKIQNGQKNEQGA